MKAKFNGKENDGARNMGSDKETVNRLLVIGYKNGEFKELIDARFYMGRSASASVVYCSVWIHGAGIHTSGRGSAGGYGYHKESAALADAIENAGYSLFGSPYPGRDTAAAMRTPCHFGGSGERAMEEALRAIGRSLGYRKLHVNR